MHVDIIESDSFIEKKYPKNTETDFKIIKNPRSISQESIDFLLVMLQTLRMYVLIIIISFFGFSCASTFVPYSNEWKVKDGADTFYAGIFSEASEKSILTGSVSMKQRTCIDATKAISTSSKISKYLVDAEKQSLTESELTELRKLIGNYRITPVLLECQPGPKDSFFGGSDWASCQCLYSFTYPGGRQSLQNDIMKVK